MSTRLAGILFAALLLTAGCGTSDRANRERGEILKVLETRRAALNAKDLQQYASVISQRYNDKGKDFARLTEELKNNFRKFERISYEADAPSITFSSTGADASAGYRMKIMMDGKELSLKGTEHLGLVKEPDGWKIIAGI